MGQVSISVNGRHYQVACDDGQEAHLTELAQYVDGKVGELTSQIGQIGDQRLLLMASLMVADELFDARHRLQNGGDSGPILERLRKLAGRLSHLADESEPPATSASSDNTGTTGNRNSEESGSAAQSDAGADVKAG